jgi:outer membrane protein OmpA-like peptidoglycan-associated protein
MRLRFALVSVFTIGFLAVAGSAFAQQDEEGCKDHPMFSRMPNYVITGCEDQEFSNYGFTMPNGDPKVVEGHYWKLDFSIKDGIKANGPLQIGRNYWNPMAAKGGKRILEDLDSGGGTMVATMPGPKGSTIWVEVSVANSGEMFTLHVLQEEGMRQDIELSAKDLADALAKTGAVTLNNILFDTGKATITAESQAPLKVVVELLKNDAALKLEIQGHTDNVGPKAANLKLSKDRADAVKAFLVAGGIDAARLTTAGLGDTQPTADNATEDGRAKNRRVVLVKK